MDIEQIAVDKPEALARIPVDALSGVDLPLARKIADAGGFPTDMREEFARTPSEAAPIMTALLTS